MSGTQPTMADAPRSPLSPNPVSDCGDKPSCSDLIADTNNYDSEDDKPKRVYWDKGPAPSSPFDPGPPSPVSPRYVKNMDEDDSDDDKPLKRPESPIKKPTPIKPTPLMLTPLKFAERQYSCKLDEDGVWRYRPEDGDFKGHKSLSSSPRVEGPPSPVPVAPYANKRESPDEWPEDEAKLTCAPQKKAKKNKGTAKKKAKKDKANARSLSSYKGDIDENSSVVEVGKWVLHMNGLGWCGLDCSDIFEEHNINGSDLLQMAEETINKLGLDLDDREIILNRIKTLQAKSKTKRSLDKAMDEV